MSQAVSQFITDLAVHFGRKLDTPEAEDAWLKSMVAALRGYGASVLKEAAQRIISTRTERSFPLPAECKKVCDDIASREALAKGMQLLQPDAKNVPEYSDWRFKLADDLVMCPMGKQAAREGWIGCLWAFCRKNMRMPKDHEIHQCKTDAKRFDEAYEWCLRGEGGVANHALVKLGDSMLARREELRARVLGEKAA